ncbi:hypothetical protein [Actinoplanes sp. OR16]|uniref:hypothetical protein n=1 Tax=Actinoplanes sp. OR16 TaxID=946334 RepID=UPI00135F18F5|nr:hypothetical protein [Actinoplanes sp. OR16]
MIPFTNPEIQLELIHSQAAELEREASKHRLARSVRKTKPRFRRAPRQSLS